MIFGMCATRAIAFAIGFVKDVVETSKVQNADAEKVSGMGATVDMAGEKSSTASEKISSDSSESEVRRRTRRTEL